MKCNCCGACCTEISISSAIPIHHEHGKPAGIRCGWLSAENLCKLFGKAERPAVCSGFKAEKWICGDNAEQAKKLIKFYESETYPSKI